MAAIKKSISVKQKESVQLTTDLTLNSINVSVNINYHRKVTINKGAADEKEFASDYSNESVALQFSGEQLDNLVFDKIEDLVKQALSQAEAKYQ